MKELLGFKDEWWDDLLTEVEHYLDGKGYRRYSQRRGMEDFSYWKKFDGYQICIKFYDFRKYAHQDPAADRIATAFTVMPLRDDGRVDLEISMELSVEQLERAAEEFFKFSQTITGIT